MPLNLIKKYNELLDIRALNLLACKRSLRNVFDRDILNNNNFRFKNKLIHPIPEQDGVDKVENLFNHLITRKVDYEENRRELDVDRAERLHWIKYHIDESERDKILLFSVEEPNGNRTYIYDEIEKYVIVLEPLSVNNT